MAKDQNNKYIPDSKEAGKKGANNELHNKSGGKDHNSNSDLQTNTPAGDSSEKNRFVSHKKNMGTTQDSSAMGSTPANKAFSFEQFTKNELGKPENALGKGKKGSVNENEDTKTKITPKDINEKIDALKAQWKQLKQEIQSVVNENKDADILKDELNECEKYMKKAFSRSNEIKNQLNETEHTDEEEEKKDEKEKKKEEEKTE